MTSSPVAGSAAANQYGVFQVHYPSEKQQAFVARLAAQKGSTDPRVAEVAAGELNLKATTRFIDELLALPDAASTAGPFRPASDKQVGFLRRLFTERDAFPGQSPADCHRILDEQIAAGTVSSKIASDTITLLMAAPRRAKAADAAEVKAGMYKDTDGAIYRVYLGQQSGRLLVKRVVGSADEGYGYEYVGAASHKLPATATPLPLEDAKAWGRMTGTCCVCARRLDVPESVEAGIGPVCAKGF